MGLLECYLLFTKMLRFPMHKLFLLLPGLVLALSCPAVYGADIDQLLAQMTLDEKLSMLHGAEDPDPAIGLDAAGYVPGIPRLGIPPLRLADGPAGIRTQATATALPAPVVLAASFDRTLATNYGKVIGMEGLARNQQVLLSPMVNMVRVPQAGRNFETLGEDPFLAGAMVAAEITGIQSEGLMATVKHYAANNQEQERLTINASIDERTLREIYLPAFEAAVHAGVASVMCAYNQVNNQFGCENHYLLQQVLRKEWGFAGFVMTDWWAMHSLAAVEHGLNLEMPGYTHADYPVLVNFDTPLHTAVQNGSISQAKVDEALRPLLTMMNRFGLLDGKAPATVSRTIDNHATALATALAGAVLLKNDNALLPLARDSANDTLFLGPTAAWTLIGGGGSSRVRPSAHDNALDAFARLGDGRRPLWLAGYDADGTVIPASALRVPGKSQHGMTYSKAGQSRIVTTLNRVGANAMRSSGMSYWEAELVAPETGIYNLLLQTDGPVASLYQDGKRLLFNDGGVLSDALLMPARTGLRNANLTVKLTAGERFHLHLETWSGDDAPVQVRLAWQTPSQRQQIIAEAVAAARKARAVVVFAHVEGSEGSDRNTLALPGYQDELITALTEQTQARIAVVLSTGAPVTMPWADKVAAILQMWYPGQAGGEATAQLLLGLANPSGKLPVSFPRSEMDTPVIDPLRYPGVDSQQQYSEGLLIGYRWYDTHNIVPLFPFGHGLSYTRFEYSDFVISGNGQAVTASFTLRNSGSQTGAEVTQLYLEPGDTGDVSTELRKLVGFDKISLAPGESRRVTITIPERSFAYWNADSHQWQMLPGRKVLAVGSSSRDLRQSSSFVYSPQRQ